MWVGLQTLVLPYLRRMQGETDADITFEKRRADFTYTVKGNRLEFVRVRHNLAGGLDIFRTQDSAVLSSAVWADGLAALPGSVLQQRRAVQLRRDDCNVASKL